MSKLTQKDFEKIADILSESKEKEKLAESFSEYLSTKNPLFCKERFLSRVYQDIPWAEATLLE